MKKIFFLSIYTCLAIYSSAQNFSTSGDIYLGLKKLNVLGSVLYIAAHPDDENTRLLTYFSKDKLYRTGYLSLTRGDGGQNLIGEEQGIELGLIRTQELLSARRIDGAEQFFSRAYDFGYSKTPAETFTKWDKEKILSDVVWVIRKFQPDVIITRFPITGEGGHGHHTASAILANEAFAAAADPNRFPEQLKFVQPWQAKRIFWNSFNFNNATPPADAFRLDVGGYNPVLGKSYGEIAAESRSQHKSQGFGATRTRGEAFEFFKSSGGSAVNQDLFEGVKTEWQRVPGGEKIGQMVNNILASFDFMQPQKSVPQLVQLYKSLGSMASGYWRDQKMTEVKNLIEAASGIWIEAFTSQPYAVQNDSLRISVILNNRLGLPAKLKSISSSQLKSVDVKYDSLLEKNKNFNRSNTVFISVENAITQPYWLAEKMEEGYFNVSNREMIGEPDVQAAVEIKVQIELEGQQFEFKKPVKYKFTDQVKGELYQPLVILPQYTVDISRPVNILKVGKDWHQQFSYTANKDLNEVKVYNGSGIVLEDKNGLKKGQRRDQDILFDASAHSPSVQSVKDTFSLNYYEVPGKVTAKSFHQIRYDHIPYISYFTDAVNKYTILDLKTYNKTIGYIVGAGDKVPEALEQMGYEVTLLTEKELARNNLQQFDAIITGVRAFNTNDWMNKYYDKLMKYVENGGNYIVQYSQANNIRGKMGPYNFSLSGKRITDENAEVSFLKPGHPVLNFPNKITQDDFKGWIQERSIYHPANLDSNYQTILRMNDPGEAAEDGSLVVAKYGKGYFTYTGLVFFRELPAGVPGAYRLFANIIALNRKKEF